MKCCSRSTLGVVIGILNILIYLGMSILMITIIQGTNSQLNDNYIEHREAKAIGTIILSAVLAISLIMIVISGILIMGIVKRLHILMLPWLILSGLGFVCDCGRLIITVILSIVLGDEFLQVLLLLIMGALMCGLEALILWPIYKLWQDIYRKNNVKHGHVIGSVQFEDASAPPQYNYYTSIPQKS